MSYRLEALIYLDLHSSYLTEHSHAGTGNAGARLLAILDPFTGQLKQRGNTGRRYAGITFDSQGVLFGLTGD
jgi:hypothetical protein